MVSSKLSIVGPRARAGGLRADLLPTRVLSCSEEHGGAAMTSNTRHVRLYLHISEP